MQKGYTLVEILIVMAIMGVLMVFGLSSFQTFTQRQVVKSATTQIYADLTYAKSLANSGKKPAGCTSLDGYSFSVVTAGSNIYNISAECVDNSGAYEVCSGSDCVRQVTLSDGVQLDTPGYTKIIFYTLNRGTNIFPQPATKIEVRSVENSDLDSNIVVIRSGAVDYGSAY